MATTVVRKVIRKNKMLAKKILVSRSQVTQENLVLKDVTIVNITATTRAKEQLQT